ncbi:MAG: DUF3822 family protein [Prevotellaceae bacterium]|nr:DUF3822 family protein [Prevotellaceae bacterium]
MSENFGKNITAQPSVRRGIVPRLAIRVGYGTMSFCLPNADGTVEYQPYTVKSGVSMAANLRTAFRESELLRGRDDRALLSIVSPVVLVPIDEYMDQENFDVETLYNHTFTGREHEAKVASVIPDLSAVAVFGVNKDLKLVVEDHFGDVRIQNVMQPVWTHLYRRSTLVGQRRKLYAYFHDNKVDVFSFQQRRFRFSNTFDAVHAHDALYYLLFVWKQLALSNEDDELHLVGKSEHMEWLITKLKSYLRRVYTLNPVADLNRAPASLIEGMEYDLMI